MNWRWIALFAAMAVPCACLAEERIDPVVDCGEVYGSIPHGALLDLLDPDAPALARLSQLAPEIAGFRRLWRAKSLMHKGAPG